MKKYLGNYKLILGLAIIPIIIVATILIVKDNNKPYIEKVLATRAYSYLPNEAKDYIRVAYDKTGELILTERNKKENTPYLNPSFVSYLELSAEEKEEIDVIPDTYILDFIEDQNYQNEQFPSRYDLMDLNFTTPYYDQSSLNICWAFASVEQAEGYLMMKNNQHYSSATERFSVRQMDYATSQSISNYNNENHFSRKLTEGGNFYTSSFIMSYGLSLVDDSYMPFNYDTDQKELSSILNFNNSNYELNSTIVMPKLNSNATASATQEYLNLIKHYIVSYGGAYVGTGAPNGTCGFKNTDGTYAIADDIDCVGETGHAMHIIGWDDNYQYAYCNSNGIHRDVSANGTCSSGTKVTGTGAWILRNSWGSNSNYKKVYLAYTPVGMNISFTTSLTPTSSRNWDNLYHRNIWEDQAVSSTSNSITFEKKIDTPEKVEAVKFYVLSMNASFKISIRSANSTYNDIKTFTVDLPGIYKIDLSDSNIVINDPSFTVTITSTNSTSLLTSSMSVFTSNINNTPLISTQNINASSIIKTEENSIKYLVYSNTKNIESNQALTYNLLKNNTSYNNYLLSTTNNKVAENNVNAVLEISKSIPPGDYDLEIRYQSCVTRTKISIPEVFSLTGEGTENNPYIIHNEGELRQMVYNMEAYYKLANDITLTTEWTPIGTRAAPFKGGLDGNNHSINNLVINSDDSSSVGLFGYMKNQFRYEYYDDNWNLLEKNDPAYIKNLKINSPNVTGARDTGVLVGTMLFDYSDQPESARNQDSSKVTIENISINGGTITSTLGNAGVLIGQIDIVPLSYRTPRVIMNNIFTSTTVSGRETAGLIGYVSDSYISGSGIKVNIEISNLENISKIIIPEDVFFSNTDGYSPIVGRLYGNAKIQMTNYIINTIFSDPLYTHYFLRYDDSYVLGGKSSETTSYTEDLTKGYYVSKTANDLFTKNASEVKDLSLYSSWEDFSTYWKQDSNKIPQLKISTINYTDVGDITLNKYDDISLLEQITGENNIQYISYEESSNEDIVEMYSPTDNRVYTDIRMKALEKGEATIHVLNNYDGLEKDITVTVNSPKVSNPVLSYYSNNGETNIVNQNLTANQSFRIKSNTFEKLGYRFKEWNTREDGSGTSYLEEQLVADGIDENLRLYAQWEEREYTIKYHANGGSGSMSDQTGIKLLPRYSYSLHPNIFERDNYTFVGWNTEPDGSGTSFVNRNEINNTYIPLFVDDVLNLYAQWSNIKYTLSFNSNGGSGTMNSREINSGLQTTIPENTFTKTGYKFSGWNTEANGSGTSYADKGEITLSSNTTLYAMWSPITYTIRYNSNEPNRLEETQTFTYDQAATLRKNTFEKDEYDFASWNTKLDGSGTSYSDEQEVINLTDKDNDIIDLFAQWTEKIEYEINYPYDQNKKIIRGIKVGTTLSEYTNKISLGTGYTVSVDTKTVNGKQVIYTGGKTKIYKNNTLVITFENSVLGDPSGDGVINSMDLLKIVRYLKRYDTFSNYQLSAADCNDDGVINSMDLLKIVRHLKGLQTI